jgi:SSS family solute:Na+ symporter
LMTKVDWFIVTIYLILSLLIGLYFTGRSQKGLSEFFLSGKKTPWWLAGISMVATTFSSDTPLYVTGLVRTHGIYENWQWWCFIFSGMLAVFVFAALWKRLGVFTDVEFISLRYSDKSAKILRGFKALYFSLVVHTIIKAQVILAMAKILDVLIGWSKWKAIVISSLVTLIYCLAGGYWGVLATDFFQFFFAFLSAFVLCVISVNTAGGIENIKRVVEPGVLNFFPPIFSVDGGFVTASFLTFLGYVGITWWSKYSSDGGGVIVQRIISTRGEKEGVKATMLFNLLHYSLRTWPWILTALASIIIYPSISDPEIAYPRLVAELMPSGLKGLMVAGFFAAFMSTLSTYLNLSSAYFVNDFYKPYLKPEKGERHYIIVARVSMVVLSIITAIVTYYVESLVEVFKFLIAFGSGQGLVYILRWFWLRINAWSEISAMIASTGVTVIVYIHPELNSLNYLYKLLLIVSISTIIWIIVTFLTKPVDEEVLKNFTKALGIRSEEVKNQLLKVLFGSLCMIGLTLGPGKLLLRETFEGIIFLSLASASALSVIIIQRVKK